MWTRHIPLGDSAERATRRRAHSKRMTDAQWDEHRATVPEAHRAVVDSTAAGVGGLSDRELMLVGAVVYWCEGAKAKPWRPTDWRLSFTNSDPGLLDVYLRFVEALGRPRGQLRYRLSIHESADVERSRRWWEEQLGLAPGTVSATTLKRHRPSPRRHHRGEDCHGCLVVNVPSSRDLYWLVEGLVKGIAERG